MTVELMTTLFRRAAGLAIALGIAACGSGTAGGAASGPASPASVPAGPASGAAGAGSSVSASAGASVLAGVYTSRQASRGENVFRTVCSQCHSETEFRGTRFRVRWSGQTVGDVYEFVSTMMPEGEPGSLDPQEYVDVVAYLLRVNAYPAGEVDLPADQDALRRIRIEAASN